MTWKRYVAQEARWSSEIGWKWCESCGAIDGLSTSPLVVRLSTESGQNCSESDVPYTCNELVTSEVYGVQKAKRSVVNQKCPYSEWALHQRSSTAFRKWIQVLWKWNIIMWNEFVAQEIRRTQKSFQKYIYSAVLILWFRLALVTYLITQSVSRELSLSWV